MSTQASTNAIKQIKEKESLPPFLLIISKDNVRKKRLISHLVEHFFKTNPPQINLIQSSTLNTEKLVRLKDEIFSPSLFSPCQIFHLANLQSLPSALSKHLEKVVSSIPPQVHFFITGEKLNKNSSLYNLAKKNNSLVEFENLHGDILNRWTAKELNRAGVNSFNPHIVELLTLVSDSNLDLLVKNIEQIALYSDGEHVETSVVHELFQHIPDPSEFELLDAIISKKPGKIEYLVQMLFRNGKSPFLLLSLLFRTYSNYLLIKLLMNKGRKSQDIAGILKLSQWVCNKQIVATRHYSLEKVRRALQAIIKADSRLKNKSIAVEDIFSDLVHQIVP